MPNAPQSPDDLARVEADPPPPQQGTTALVSGLVLGFAGFGIMLFGLPLAVALPAGLIWGKNTDIQTILSLIGVSVVGLIFVYAASLLIGAAIRSFKAPQGPE
jgi:hypothetical protein